MQNFKGGFSEMKTKKIVSLLLAVLMACSVFAGLSVSADEATTHIYTVVGAPELCGVGSTTYGWDPSDTANDMTLEADGTYVKEYTNVANGNYTLKVAEDRAWAVSFGATVDSNDNVEFNVPTDGSTVKVVLTISGTKEVTSDTGVVSTVTAGAVKVLVNGADAPDPTVPDVTTHYIAGTIAPGGWDQTAASNLMTLNGDTYEFEITGVAAGAYEFKMTTNGAWEPAYGFQGMINAGGSNETLTVDADNSTVKFTFKASEGFLRAYVNGTEVEVERTTASSAPTEVVIGNETSGICSKGGYYKPAEGVSSRRYFFEMPEDWMTFSNATACAYWWEGTDNCNTTCQLNPNYDPTSEGGWQYSYKMRKAGVPGRNIYYIDVPDDVATIIFHNGIDGGQKADPENGIEASANWGKNYQTVNISVESLDPGDNPNYPNGLESLDKMIYVIDPTNVTVNEYSGATNYGGDWMYLHADGTSDYEAGTTFDNVLTADVAAEGVSLDKTSAALFIGKTVTLTATVVPLGADNREVTWSSSNEKVATVDQTGKVTAKSKGTAVITATTKDGTNLSASATITVKQAVTSVTIKKGSASVNGKTLSVKKGSSTKLTAACAPASASLKTVTWTTSNKKVVTVSNGTVKAVGAGSAKVTAKAKDGSNKSAYVNFKVTVPVTKVTVKLKNKAVKTATVKVKQSITLKAVVAPSNATKKTVKWTTSSKKIATVSAKGVVKGVKAGKATIKATAQDGSNKAASVKVTVKKK
jgi:uncharacterized protein YjdB